MSATHHAAHVVVQKHATRPAIGFGASTIPKIGLLAWCANRFDPEQLAFLDRIGGSVRPLHDLQFIQADGTGYFTNTAMVTAGTTVTNVSGSGTTTYSSPSAGRINMTSGTAWDFTVEWSDGKVSEYAYCSLVTSTYAQCFDRSGNGRHLIATGFADLSLVCLSGKEYGSDVLNLYGWSAGGLGSELVINGDFSLTSSWSLTGATISGGTLNINPTVSDQSANQVIPLKNTSYLVSFDYNATVSGVLRLYIGSTKTDVPVNGAGSYSGNLSYSAGDAKISFVSWYSSSPFIGTIDNVSVKQSYPSTVPIPSSITPGTDALGNALTYPGRAKYNLQPVNAPCVAFDGSGSLAVNKDGVAYDLTGSSIENGGTASLAISTSSITCAAGGTCWALVITEADENVITFPLSESDGTTVHGYDTSGNTYTGTCTGFLDEGAIWSTQDQYFHALEFGDSDGGLGPELANTLYPPNNASSGVTQINGVYSFDSVAYAGSAQIFNATDQISQYKVVSLISNYVYGTVRISLGGSSGATHNSNGSHVDYITASANKTFTIQSLTEGTTLDIQITSYRKSYPSTVKIPANLYNPGYDCLGNLLTNPPLKYNDSCGYVLPDADQIRAATRWVYGTANDWVDADGTMLEVADWTTLISLTDGQTLFADDRYGLSIYSLDRPDSSTIRAARLYGGYTAPDIEDADLEYDVFY